MRLIVPLFYNTENGGSVAADCKWLKIWALELYGPVLEFLVCPRAYCVTLGMLLHIAELQFPYL